MATTTNPTGIKLTSTISPPPPDIVIAQASTPLHVEAIAEMLGLEAGEYDLYGPHQAKVRV